MPSLRESGNVAQKDARRWIPAFAGTTGFQKKKAAEAAFFFFL